MNKNYTNSIIKNNNGDKIQITNIKGKNKKGNVIYGYLCSKCGTESMGTLDKIKRNKGCIYCKGKQISNSELLSKDKILFALKQNNQYVDIIGEYKGKNIECQLKCNKHNIVFNKRPASFLYFKSKICPECIKENKSIKSRKYTLDNIRETLEGLDYQWLNPDEYKNASSSLLLKCKKCDKISKANITSLINGRKCKKCSGLSKKSTEDFKKEIFNLVGNEYVVLGEYENNKSPIRMKHIVCGHEWDTLPTNFLYNEHRCPKCNKSKGEKAIANYLIDNKIKYISEYSFDDCFYKKKLRFDFFLIDYNTCIEFQGQQHYISVDYMGGKDDLEKRQKRDYIKREYCKLNNINLIEIPYFQIQNIKKFLDKEIFNKTA